MLMKTGIMQQEVKRMHRGRKTRQKRERRKCMIVGWKWESRRTREREEDGRRNRKKDE